MKISYRNHPILQKVHTKQLGQLISPPEDYENLSRNRDILRKAWTECAEQFGSNVQIITKPFGDAIHEAMPKMTSPELANELLHKNLSGVLIWENHAFCYSIKSNFLTYFDFVTTPNRDVGLIVFFKFQLMEGVRGQTREYYLSTTAGTHDNTLSKMHVSNLIAALNFITYAEVETKYIPAHGKSKDIVCKYVNDTPLPLKVLDSKWFTTLVKSDAFKVRGHFRLQPKKKDGEWTKELIWINDFKKDGYTAPARKLALA